MAPVANDSSLTLDGSGAGQFNIPLSGTGTLTKVGTGSWSLSGSNTFSGPIAVNVGTLALTGSNALLGGSTLTFGGGTLQFSSANKVDYSAFIVGSGSAIAIDTNSQNVTFANSLASSNTGGLTKLGAGTANLVLDGGTLEYSGTAQSYGSRYFTIGAGGAILKASQSAGNWYVVGSTETNNSSLTLAGAANGNVQLAITGAGSLIKNGSGIWTLERVNTFTGATTINAGTLGLSGSTTTLGSGSSAVTLANVSGAVLSNGYWTGSANAGVNFSIGSLAGGGSSGGNVHLVAGTITVGTDNTSTNYAGTIYGNEFGAASLTKVGSGTLTLTNASTYSGATTINGGSLQLGDGSAGNDASLASASLINNASLVYNLAGTKTVSGVISGSGSLIKSGSGTVTFTGSNS